jgi:cell division transport system permease protein
VKLRTIVDEAFRSLRATVSTTVAATLTVLIGMFVLGLSIAFGTWLISWSDHLKQELVVKVYMNVGATRAQTFAVYNRIHADPRVKDIRITSPAQGFAEMKRQNPQLFNIGVPTNPIPWRLTVYPVHGEQTAAISQTLSPKPPNVDEVTYGRKTTNAVLRFAQAIEITFLVAVAVMLLAAILMIGNTIRLSIFARRREIEVMKLVGATNWFVRGPFMVEGFLCGLMGSIAAIILLVISKLVVVPKLDFIQVHGVQALDFGLVALLILVAGLMLGAAGSGLTVRRFLRV